MSDPGTDRPPLIMAYVVLAFGVLALVGYAIRHDDMFATFCVFGVLGTMAHAISFFHRAHKRRAPAVLERRGHTILAIVLGAMVAVSIASFVVTALHVTARSAAPFFWMVVVIVLASLRSARRVAAMQLAATWLGIPQMIWFVAGGVRVRDEINPFLVPETMLFAMAVIAAAGAALDKLYQSVADRSPVQVPEAVVIER